MNYQKSIASFSPSTYHFEQVEKIHEFSLPVQHSHLFIFRKNQNQKKSLVSRLPSLVSRLTSHLSLLSSHT